MAALATALACATGCWSEDYRPIHRSPTAAELALEDGLGVDRGHRHLLQVHWDTAGSFDELVRRSDLIIRGTVESRRPSAGDRDLPMVASTVRVRRILRAGEQARGVVEGGTIEISEVGGRLADGCFAEPDDKPVLKRDEDAVFFLTGTGHPGAYQVAGGWQGRLWVLGRKIRSLAADLHPGDAAGTAHDGEALEELVQAVQAAPCG